MLLLYKFFICRCVNVRGSKNVGQNRSVKCFAGFVKFMVNLSYNTVLLLVVFGIFFSFLKYVTQLPDPPSKKTELVLSRELFPLAFLPSAFFQLLKSPACLACRRIETSLPESLWRPTEEVFPATVFFHMGAWGRTEPHPCPSYGTPQQNPLTCLMRAAACRRLLRSATSSWSCCHSFWRLSVCLRMSSWRMGFFWLSSQPLLITSAHTALCELHSASRA